MLKLFLRYSNVVCAIFISRIFSSAETIPSEAYFDGLTLTIPYLEVSGIQHEAKLIPSTNSVLTYEDCPILCLEVLSAADSMISSPRDPATFDGSMLNTPRVAVGNEIYTGSFRYLDQYKNAFFFSAVSAQLAPFFSSTDRQSWTSDEIEARFDFCTNNSSRQIAPAPFADINRDGFQDILVPFSCYQDKLPKFDGGVNNAKLKSGMVLFCSDEVGKYRDCSMEIFGAPYIDTSKGGPGGLYYIHNAEEPIDLNNDGYLDYALNLSRDDGVGRQSYDVTNDYERILSECFDGNESLALEYTENDLSNCAYFSDQYVFLSRGDGTYSNVKLPWKANWTHAMRSIPNEVGGYDLISIGYGEVEVARINGTEAFDIKETYESFSNFFFCDRSQSVRRLLLGVRKCRLLGY